MSKVFHHKFHYMVKPFTECKVMTSEWNPTKLIPTQRQSLIVIDVWPTESLLCQKSFVVFSLRSLRSLSGVVGRVLDYREGDPGSSLGQDMRNLGFLNLCFHSKLPANKAESSKGGCEFKTTAHVERLQLSHNL
jgi:hypothetical protein